MISKILKKKIFFSKKIIYIYIYSPELYVNAKLENNKMKFGEMIQRWKYINWELYFKKRFGDKYSEIKEDDDVLLFPAMYFDNLEKVLAETDVETLAIYFEWLIIYIYIYIYIYLFIKYIFINKYIFLFIFINIYILFIK